MSLPRLQTGVALITALLIVALAAMLASSLLASQNLTIHRSGNLLAIEQANWYTQGVEAWAGVVLTQDRRDNQIDHLKEPWAQQLDYLPVEGGYLKGRLADAQGLFNLNSLAGTRAEAAAQQLQRMLENIPDVDSFNAPALTSALRDWVDADSEPGVPEGAEDDYYLALREHPHRCANRPFTSVTELRQVRGVTPELYAALLPFVTVLPVDSRININTAPPAVLASLAAGLSVQELGPLVAARESKEFQDVSSFLSDPVFAGRQIDANQLSVSTRFFNLYVRAEVGTARLNLYSLLFRGDDGRVQVYRHSRDTL